MQTKSVSNVLCDSTLLKTAASVYQQNLMTLVKKYDHKTIKALIEYAVKQAKHSKRTKKKGRFSKRKTKSTEYWIFCDTESNCYQILRACIQIEVQSTYYWLRLLSSLMIRGFIKVQWMSKSKMTGIWEADSKHISIVLGVKKGKIFVSNQLERCVFIFGPSASGKTFWTEELLKNVLPIYYDSFPHSFMTIDGGNMRETSQVYQMVIQSCSKNRMRGLNNLVKVDLEGIVKCRMNKDSPYCSLFDSSPIKRTLQTFLQVQKKKYDIRISLVIPETFADYELVRVKSLGKDIVQKKFSKWLEMSGSKGNWIGIMVWQHKSNSECDFPREKKCVGTTESGVSREAVEGKKYSASAYKLSMKAGRMYLTAPGVSLAIHNSGSKSKKSDVVIHHKAGEDIAKLEKMRAYVVSNTLADCKIVEHK